MKMYERQVKTMDQNTHDEIMKWISKEENIAKLSLTEKNKIALALSEFTEKVAPIIIKHITGDKKTTFLFKM